MAGRAKLPHEPERNRTKAVNQPSLARSCLLLSHPSYRGRFLEVVNREARNQRDGTVIMWFWGDRRRSGGGGPESSTDGDTAAGNAPLNVSRAVVTSRWLGIQWEPLNTPAMALVDCLRPRSLSVPERRPHKSPSRRPQGQSFEAIWRTRNPGHRERRRELTKRWDAGLVASRGATMAKPSRCWGRRL